jgi:hypothetical protein
VKVFEDIAVDEPATFPTDQAGFPAFLKRQNRKRNRGLKPSAAFKDFGVHQEAMGIIHYCDNYLIHTACISGGVGFFRVIVGSHPVKAQGQRRGLSHRWHV